MSHHVFIIWSLWFTGALPEYAWLSRGKVGTSAKNGPVEKVEDIAHWMPVLSQQNFVDAGSVRSVADHLQDELDSKKNMLGPVVSLGSSVPLLFLFGTTLPVCFQFECAG